MNRAREGRAASRLCTAASLFVCAVLAGCSGEVGGGGGAIRPGPGVSVTQPAAPARRSAPAITPGRTTTAAPQPPPSRAPTTRRDDRVGALVAERARLKPEEVYRIGPEDLLEINVFDLPEMSQKVRVSTSGFVQLPLIGAVRASGQTENELATEITSRLTKDYLQEPQVNVFVEEYKSQQVAVSGAVAKPGLYPLTRKSYTILDMLSLAGGLTKDAGSVVELVPAGSTTGPAAIDVASAGGWQQGTPPGDPVTIDLAVLMRGQDSLSANLRVLAGDVIFVPQAGSFTIEGWIDKPGTYPLSPNMTALAALSSGGGPLFPSSLSAVEILHAPQAVGGGRTVEIIDLEAVRKGHQPDVTLRAGDVVRVPGNVLLMVPWGFYSLVRDLVRLGGAFPIP